MTKNEWIEWQTHPVTKEWFDYLENLREKIKEGWATGSYTDSSEYGTIQRNSEAIGHASLLAALIDTEFEDVEGAKVND